MGFFVENGNFSLRFSLTLVRLIGYWPPTHLNGKKLVLYRCYGFFCFFLINGVFLIAEVGDLCLVWGDLPLMTGTAFVLFTNMAFFFKCLNVVVRRRAIMKIITDGSKDLNEEKSIEGRSIIKRYITDPGWIQSLFVKKFLVLGFGVVLLPCLGNFNQETRHRQMCYVILSIIVLIGWSFSAEKNHFPIRAWYPYDTSKSPAYELTYTHQVFILFVASILNVSMDVLVTTLIAQCRCRLRLIALSLRNLCNDQDFTSESTSNTIGLKLYSETLQFTQAQENIVQKRIKSCAIRHQKVLETISLLQNTFSEPTFFQFTVTLIIICATAFELVTQTSNYVRFMSMGFYLLDMMFQVFIYCYEGEHLIVESEDLADAAYDIPWYSTCVRTRRSILIIMVRCRRVAKLTAGAFTTLSLTTFMAIIKTSYSLFTLLQQVTE